MSRKRGKKYSTAAEQVDKNKAYTVEEAVALVQKLDTANFDDSIEAVIKLNVDTKQADQQLRGAVVLPNGTGKDQKVIVFAKGDKAKEATAAGADVVGEADLAQKNYGWLA